VIPYAPLHRTLLQKTGVIMAKFRFPFGLVIWVVVILILGLVSRPLIGSWATEEQLAKNVLLNAIPFILIFVSILLGFITIIVVVSRLLNDNINPGVYRIVESIIIAGIVLGVIGMFQPWHIFFFKNGFRLLLISTLSFILWSHVHPKSVQRQEELS
jgi:hypothetical protein